MILIVEGSDLVGKSTIADAIGTRHGWPVVKIRWALQGDPEVETRAMAKSTIAILDATHPDVIYDRIYFSWWAYGPELGYDVSYMPELISRYKPVEETRLVLLTASDEELRRRFEHEPDHWFPLNVILGANRRFPNLVKMLPEGLACLEIIWLQSTRRRQSRRSKHLSRTAMAYRRNTFATHFTRPVRDTRSGALA